MLAPVMSRNDQIREAEDDGRTDRELVEANRRMREFLALLGHELRSPLAAMQYALFALRQRGDAAADPERTLSLMDRQLRLVVSLVQDIEDVSCIELGKMRLHVRPLNLARVLAGAVESVRAAIEGAGHRLDVSLPPDWVSLDADPVRLEQVLTNLLNNAAKYTPAGGRIWLTAEVEGDEVVLSVGDSGIGMPPEVLPHVFDPFWQGERTGDHARCGLGIGLALVRKLTELHGGSVSASSDGLNRGSEFVVRLPSHAEGWTDDRSDPCGCGTAGRNAPPAEAAS
ncbi:MAG: sensor histidine kinase [Gemmataceae bacterium]